MFITARPLVIYVKLELCASTVRKITIQNPGINRTKSFAYTKNSLAKNVYIISNLENSNIIINFLSKVFSLNGFHLHMESKNGYCKKG